MSSSVIYSADLTAGSLKLRESRIIAGLLLVGADEKTFREAVVTANVLQTRTPATAVRLARLIRGRLSGMDAVLWRMVSEGDKTLATQALLAATLKHSRLLRDFMDLGLRDEYRLLHTELEMALWTRFLIGCESRDPSVARWSDSTRRRLRSTVFQILAQAEILADTASRKLKKFMVLPELRDYLAARGDLTVLNCLQMP
ncbi:MAG: DUF1819 family protein [Verrucomicrobiota bacterium]